MAIKPNLFIATPMYGGLCYGTYLESMLKLQAWLNAKDIEAYFSFLYNESLITRGRNTLVNDFLKGDATHLMFIDADIEFQTEDILKLYAHKKDVVVGAYPKKGVAWDKIRANLTDPANKDKNLSDRDMASFGSDYAINFKFVNKEAKTIGVENGLIKLHDAGTGFMMIRKNTFKKFEETFPYQSYKPDHVRTAHFDGSREIFAFFDTPIDGKRMYMGAELKAYLEANPNATPDDIVRFVDDPNNTILRQYSKRYLSEDYMFCQWVRNMGLKVWLCPWMQLNHTGSYTFGGSLAALASVGAAATADISKIKK